MDKYLGVEDKRYDLKSRSMRPMIVLSQYLQCTPQLTRRSLKNIAIDYQLIDLIDFRKIQCYLANASKHHTIQVNIKKEGANDGVVRRQHSVVLLIL
jgi:hypothetical protein